MGSFVTRTFSVLVLVLVFASGLFAQTTFYSQGDGNFSTTTNWDTNRGGGGTDPTGFDAGDIFVVQNGHTVTMDNVSNLIQDLIVESGGTFDNSSNTIVFAVGGQGLDVQSGGDYKHSTGTIEANAGALNTVVLQIAAADTFYNIVTSSPLTLDGAEFIIEGNLNFSTTRTFTVQNGASVSYINAGELEYNASRTISSEWPTTGSVPIVKLTSGAVTNSSGTRTVGTKLVRSSGTLTVSGGSLAYASDATLEYNSGSNTTVGDEWPSSSGPQNVEMTLTGGSSLSSSGALSRTIIEDLTINVGTLDLGTGTLTVAGSVAGSVIDGQATISDNTTLLIGDGAGNSSEYQEIRGNLTLNKLTVDKRSGASTVVELTGTSSLTFTSGSTLDISNGTLDLGTGSMPTTNLASCTLSVSGTLQTGGNTDWTSFGTRTFNSNSTLELDGTTASETIPVGTYENITVNKSGQVAQAGGVITLASSGNTLRVQAGTLDLNGNTPSPATSGVLQVDAGATLKTTSSSGDGADINLANFGTKTFNGTVEFNGTTNSSSYLIPAETFNNLVMNNSAGYGVAGGVTVGGILTFTNGVITTTTSNEVTLSAGASVAGSPGSATHISGPVIKEYDATHVGNVSDSGEDIPTGKDGVYRPVKLSFATVTGTGTVTAEMINSDPVTSNDPFDNFTDTYDGRYWDIVAAGATFGNGDLVLTYTGYSPAATANIRIVQGPDADGANWDVVPSHAAPNTSSLVEHDAVTDFSTNTRFSFATLQATKLWNGGTTGNWNTDGNWSDGIQPSPGDIVILDNTNQGSAYVVTLNTAESIGDFTINPASANIELQITGGSLTISGTGEALTLSNNATNTATLTISGPTGNAIVMSNDGNVNIENGSVYNLNTGTGISTGGSETFGATSQTNIASTTSGALKALSYGDLTITNASGTQSVSGSISCENFTMDDAGNATVNGGLTVGTNLTKSGSGTLTVTGGTLDVTGTIGISAGEITTSGTGGNLNAQSTVTNSGGTITLAGTGASVVSGTFTNTSGALALTGTGTATFSSQLTNGGSVSVGSSAGTVSFAAFANGSGGTLSLSNGNGVTFSGAYAGLGTITASGAGAVQFQSTFSPSGNCTFASQALSLQDNVNVGAGTFTPSTNTSFTGTDFQTSGTGAVSSSTGQIIFAGASGQTITDNVGSLTFNDLVINNTSNVTLNDAVSVAGDVTLTAGDFITSSSNLMTLGASATISSGSNSTHIDGPLAKVLNGLSSFTFPVGTGDRWRRVRLESTEDTQETFTVEYLYSNPITDIGSTLDEGNGALNHISINQYWSVQRAGSVGANVRLHWEDTSDGVDETRGDMIVAHWIGTGSNFWQSEGGVASGSLDAPGYVTSAEVDNFETGSIYFTFGSTTTDNSLPVELASFEAAADYGKVTLNWKTASELDNLGFNIYRKAQNDLDDWNQVNEELIDGQGNTSTETNYSFVDSKVVSGETYTYKLESVSLNGVRVEEKTVTVQVLLPEEYVLYNNYPNPFNPTTNIKFLLPEVQNVTITIYDMQGRVVKNLLRSSLQPVGEHVLAWDATDNSGSRVASGVYFYRFTAGNFTKIKKMMLLK